MKNILPIFASFGGGVLVGGAYAAFVTLIKVFPRLLQFTETHKYHTFYKYVFIFSSLIFTLVYFFDFNIKIGLVGTVFAGLFAGIFLGVFSSALAETLNVIPVISKKFKIKKKLEIVFISLILGKVCGAFYYFIILNGGKNG